MSDDRSGVPLRLWGLPDIRPSPQMATAISTLMVAAVAFGDFATGPYLVFASFYIIPVAITAWFAGRTPALLVGAAAALAGAVSTALDPGEVTPQVYVWNGVVRFITYAAIAALVAAERRAVATIRELSEVDPLTRLDNRRRFYERAELELRRAARSGEPIAVVYVDVDDLKARNDSRGHQAGDQMLCEVADVARDTFRSTDLLARLGGDEFCFLLPGIDLAQADEAVDRFAAALGRSPVPIHISAGVVGGIVDDDLDLDAIVRSADEAMYVAKTSGKGQRRSRPTLRDLHARSEPDEPPGP